MFPKFMQVGLYTGTCIRGWGVIFGMLIRFHIWGRIFGWGEYVQDAY